MDEWRQEHEWRLFCTSNCKKINDEKFTIAKCKPIGVYLGRRTSEINKKLIMNIAREKNIKVYQMQLDSNSEQYRLRSVEV